MEIDRLETHDRFEKFSEQKDDISAQCQKMMDNPEFGDQPFYMFAHPRTIDFGERCALFSSGVYKTFAEVPQTRLIWIARLTKPKAQTNSMLFKGYPKEGLVKIIWMIPPRELWGQYEKGNICESNTIAQSIHDFQYNREALERKEDDDLSEEAADALYKQVSQQANRKQKFNKLIL